MLSMLVLDAEPILSFDAAGLKELRRLTNAASRGDLRDDGSPAGSAIRRRIDRHLKGEELFPEDCWAVTARLRDRSLAGWALLMRRDEDHHGTSLSVPDGALGLYVDPTWRRCGIGSLLVQATREVARKNGMGRLLANPWNPHNSRFFEGQGFRVVEERVPGWCPGVSTLDL